MEREFQQFMFSGVLWHEIGQKVAFPNLNIMEDLLNVQLDLFDYGSGLTSIFFIFTVVQPDDTIHEEALTYRRREKEVFAQIKMPYDLVASYDTDQVLQLMAATYLRTLERLDMLRIPDFDSARLAQDVQRLFEDQGWLVRETADK